MWYRWIIGDLIYCGTGILIGAGETIITFGDKLPAIFQWAADTGSSLSDKVGSNESNTRNI